MVVFVSLNPPPPVTISMEVCASLQENAEQKIQMLDIVHKADPDRHPQSCRVKLQRYFYKLKQVLHDVTTKIRS